MRLNIIKDDITNLHVDAIVNAANTMLLEGSGVCGAIFNKAGKTQLREACETLAPIKTGTSTITPGFNLHAKHIIHTVGPIYESHHKTQAKQLLINAYTSAIELAKQHNLNTIAFPLISSGIYGYPLKEALQIAINTLSSNHNLDITLVLYDTETYNLALQEAN